MGSYKEVLTMVPWLEKGCAICRQKWQSGSPPPEIAVNIALHASLHRCDVCGSFWEEAERYATTIILETAKTMFPDANL